MHYYKNLLFLFNSIFLVQLPALASLSSLELTFADHIRQLTDVLKNQIFLKSATHWVFVFYWVLGIIGFFRLFI